MRITGAKIYKNGAFETGDLVTNGEWLDSAAAADGEIVEAFGCRALPGLVALRLAGDVNVKFAEGDTHALHEGLRAAAGAGTLAVAADVDAEYRDHAKKVVAAAITWRQEEAPRRGDDAELAALNFVKPLVHAASAKGEREGEIAQEDAEALVALAKEGQAAGLAFDVVVDAAEPVAAELVQKVSHHMVAGIACGDATFAQAEACVKAGATMVNHAWDKDFDLEQKDPGALGAIAQKADGVLVLEANAAEPAKKTLDAAFAQFGGRLALTTTVAGSKLSLYDAMRRLMDAGVPQNMAIDAVTAVPARALGIEKDYGSLEDGKLANVVLVDEAWHIKHVINKGKLLF
jgi:N-acetylglucosamine-6-phosphate deacetylase